MNQSNECIHHGYACVRVLLCCYYTIKLSVSYIDCRSRVFIQNQHQYLFFCRASEIQSLFIFNSGASVFFFCYSIGRQRNCQSKWCVISSAKQIALIFSAGNFSGWINLISAFIDKPIEWLNHLLFQNKPLQAHWLSWRIDFCMRMLLSPLYWLCGFIFIKFIYWFFVFYCQFSMQKTELDWFICAHLHLIQSSFFGRSLFLSIPLAVSVFVCFPLLICLLLFLILFCSFIMQGTVYDKRYPIAILMTLGIFGALCGLFLPETLHQKLPDSMHEARQFGADQVNPFFFIQNRKVFIQNYIPLLMYCCRNSGVFQRRQRKLRTMAKSRKPMQLPMNWKKCYEWMSIMHNSQNCVHSIVFCVGYIRYLP